jgi:hypothetical protein
MKTDGRTYMMKITVAFRNSAEVPKNCNNFPRSFLITKVFIEPEAQLRHLQCHSRAANGLQLRMPHKCNERLTY